MADRPAQVPSTTGDASPHQGSATSAGPPSGRTQQGLTVQVHTSPSLGQVSEPGDTAITARTSSSGNMLGEPLLSSGITAVAHVYAADVGVSLQNETVDAIHYDDATQVLMVVKGGVVFAYDLAMDAPGHHEQLIWTYPLLEGPRVTSMRCSLDHKMLGCLRGGMLLELVELTSGVTTVHKAERSDLLGFFFTEAPGADVVLVGKSGLELFEFAARRRGLRCKERVKVGVAWYVWTHETRCCLVATGPAGAQYLQAWQFVTSGTLALPPFVVGAGPAVAAVAALGAGPAALPMPMLPPAIPALLAGPGVTGAAGAPPSAPLSPRHVRLLKLYGRVYCAYINTSTSKLELYRFYTDTVALQHTYELFSTNVDLSVVDHVLIVHHLDTAMTVLIDVGAAAADMPVADPLPLAVLHPPPPPPRQPLPPAPLSPPPYQPAPKRSGGSASGQAAAPPSPPSNSGLRGVRSSGSKELTHWEFIMPCTVIDRGQQAVYRLYIDLRAVADSCSNPVLLASFLQRRRSPLLPQLAIAPKQLLLGLLRSCLEEQQPPATLRRLFQHLCVAYADVSSAVARMGGRASPAAAAAVLSLNEISTQVFHWYRDQLQQQVQEGRAGRQPPADSDGEGEEEPGRHRLDLLYVQAALSEFLAVATLTGVQPPAALLSLQLQLLLQQGLAQQADMAAQCLAAQHPQLQQAVAVTLASGSATVPLSGASPGLGTEGGAGSSASGAAVTLRGTGVTAQAVVAAAAALPQSLGFADGGGPAPAEGGHEALVQQLLDSGNVLQAARVARRLRVTSVHPTEMLRAAAATGDVIAFASVYRCFRDALLPVYPQLEAARAHLMRA